MNNLTAVLPHFEAHTSYVAGKKHFDCELIRKIDWSVACDFVLKTPACHQKSFVQYLKVVFCDMPTSTAAFVLAGIYFAILMAVLYLFLVSIAAFYCVPNTIALAHHFGLNEDNTGSIVLTLFNSASFFLALMIDNDYTDRDTQVNYKYGNAVLSSILYSGLIILLYPFYIHYPYLLRNELVLIFITTFVGWRVANYKTIEIWVPILLISFWMLYNILVFAEESLVKKRYKDRPLPKHHQPFTIKFPVNDKCSVPPSNNPNSLLCSQFWKDLNPIKFYETKTNNKWTKAFTLIGCPVRLILNLFIPVVDYRLPNHGWSKLLNCTNIITTACLIPFLQYRFLNPICLTVSPIIATATFLAVFKTSRTDEPPRYHLMFAFFGIVSGAIITQFIVTELYGLWYMIINVNGLTKQNIGITIHKWIMTIIDLVVVIVIAGLGYPSAAFQSCITNPVLHYTMILGIYWIKPSHYSNVPSLPPIRTEHDETGVIFITISSSMTYIAAGFTNFYMRRSIGIFLIIVYGLYFTYIILSEYEVIHPYGTNHFSDFGPETEW